MGTLLKTVVSIAVLCFVFSDSYAQTTVKKKTITTKNTTAAPKKTSPTVPGKEVTVTLKNLSEGTVAIFAGLKEELKNTLKKKTVGGLSKNTLYLHVNEVVCILSGEKTVSCTAITEKTTLLEINISGNVITAK